MLNSQRANQTMMKTMEHNKGRQLETRLPADTASNCEKKGDKKEDELASTAKQHACRR
jgi:hypothetical protein